MKKINTFKSTMLPLAMSNVDTDQIMPKQFLKRVERTGYGEYLFFDWKKDPSFVLNDEKYHGAKVLVAGDNFGTGSSREHAPWGLQDWGFDAIISSKFADIFKLNSINIGLLPIETSKENVDYLFEQINKDSNCVVEISVEEKFVKCNNLEFKFQLDEFSQNRILNGLDKIDLSLKYTQEIENYFSNRKSWKPRLI